MFVLDVLLVFLSLLHALIALIVGLMLVEATKKATSPIQKIADLKQLKHGSSITESRD